MTSPPSVSDSPTTLERLQEVARELFAERGYSGTSMSEIASRVGIRKPSLYNYYASKEELLLDLVESSLDSWQHASLTSLAAGGPNRQRLRRHLEDVMRYLAENPASMAILRVASTQIGGDLGARVESMTERYWSAYLERMRRFFADAVEEGELRGEPPTLALFWSLFVDGLLLHTFHRGVTGDGRARLDELFDHLWRGLGGAG